MAQTTREERLMAGYGGDITVYVEDKAGDLGAPGSPAPWWISPDVDIPAHSGMAVQGPNDVRIRVHSHEEPILTEKIVAEVYVGTPGLVMSPTTGTKRIDPGNLRFRPPGVGVAGTEPVADVTGGTLTFPWTPSSSAGQIDGPGHHCLIVRAFPENVTPPTTAFDVPNEGHEAQHNIEVLTTTKMQADMSNGGAGTPWDPRRRETGTGMWWEEFVTTAVAASGRRYIVWAFDPEPSGEVVEGVRPALEEAKIERLSDQPPDAVSMQGIGMGGNEIDPRELLKNGDFVAQSGLGQGVFPEPNLLGAAALDLEENKPARLILRFDHSNIDPNTAVVLHGAQWSENGTPEGGMTVIALAPLD
jgi:hypothetical protein